MSLFKSQITFTQCMAEFLRRAPVLGYDITMGEVYRPPFVQEHYLKRGLTKAKYSNHTDRLAFDCNAFKKGNFLTKTEEYFELGRLWNSLHPNCIWGGDFKCFPDGNHFEFKKLEL